VNKKNYCGFAERDEV